MQKKGTHYVVIFDHKGRWEINKLYLPLAHEYYHPVIVMYDKDKKRVTDDQLRKLIRERRPITFKNVYTLFERFELAFAALFHKELTIYIPTPIYFADSLTIYAKKRRGVKK